MLSNTGGLARTGYSFVGWNTLANGSGTTYTTGNTFEMGSGNVTLYAEWSADVDISIYSNIGRGSGINHVINLGDASADVYLVSTNTNATAISPASITLSSSGRVAIPTPAGRSAIHGEQPVFRDLPEVLEFNEGAVRRLARRSSASAMRSMALPSSRVLSVVGDSHTFLDYEGGPVNIPSTARSVVTDGTVTLTVWVADDGWQDCVSSCRVNLVNQAMVDMIADAFLQSGDENDIYDWVRAVFGDEWGPHEYDNLIDETNEVDILLYDIDADNSTNGGVAGFFHAKDILARQESGVLATSNERLMFYLDSVLLAQPEGSSWETTDSWPRFMISTLAHEFQHMIHFYQKQVKRDGVGETWLNEMSSMVAEDLVADKAMADGPRGVAYDDPGAGASGNVRGELPLYNVWNDIQVTRWGGELKNYSINYALGAYLARVYSGAELFKDIVQSGHDGTSAIENAIEEQGFSISFGEVLGNWAIANILSDDTSVENIYKYNSGDWAYSSVDGASYRLGSINLYNYSGYGQSGPRLYNSGQYASIASQEAHSNIYIDMGTMNGNSHIAIKADEGNTVSVIIKR